MLIFLFSTELLLLYKAHQKWYDQFQSCENQINNLVYFKKGDWKYSNFLQVNISSSDPDMENIEKINENFKVKRHLIKIV